MGRIFFEEGKHNYLIISFYVLYMNWYIDSFAPREAVEGSIAVESLLGLYAPGPVGQALMQCLEEAYFVSFRVYYQVKPQPFQMTFTSNLQYPQRAKG